MAKSPGTHLSKSASRLLVAIASGGARMSRAMSSAKWMANDAAALIAADLACRTPAGVLEITAAGRAYIARMTLARGEGPVDPFLGQHLDLVRREISAPAGPTLVVINEAESPLIWLARRKGRDGRAYIEPYQLQAGERLRSEFTYAQLMPRTTSNWEASVAHERRNGGEGMAFSEAAAAARQRLRQTLDAMGPEFAGILLDVCCFLKRLEDIESERAWPSRSAKIVLQLGLDRLARHYGYAREARGKSRGPLRTWLAPDVAFPADNE